MRFIPLPADLSHFFYPAPSVARETPESILLSYGRSDSASQGEPSRQAFAARPRG